MTATTFAYISGSYNAKHSWVHFSRALLTVRHNETIDLTVRIIELKASIDKAYKELLPNNKLMIDLSVRKRSNAELYVEQVKS